MISEQGKEIVKLCERKLELQNRAERSSDYALHLINELKRTSDEQYMLLQNMRDIDLKISFLSERL